MNLLPMPGLFDGLPAAAALRKSINQGLEQVEELLLASVREAFDHEIVSHLLLGGGKRARPLLTLLASHLGAGVNDDVIKAAAAVELIHLGSLYHDDVMDEAQTRRGLDAAHRVWGKSAAILAGDLLFARSNVLGLPLGQEAINIQARTFQRLVIGQLNETLGLEGKPDPVQAYINILRDKTGSLIAASAQLGAVTGKVPAEFTQALGEFGESVGVAFQLIDDVIDLSDEQHSGKTAGNDIRSGVMTLPVLLLKEQAAQDSQAAQLLERVRRVPEDSRDLPEILQILREHEVTAATLATARQWADRANAALELLPKCPARWALQRFTDMVLSREA